MGRHCEKWKQIYDTSGDPGSARITEEGDCSTDKPDAFGALLLLYANRSDAVKDANAIKWGECLVGPNWLIVAGNGHDIPGLAKKLGGAYDTENYNK